MWRQNQSVEATALLISEPQGLGMTNVVRFLCPAENEPHELRLQYTAPPKTFARTGGFTNTIISQLHLKLWSHN